MSLCIIPMGQKSEGQGNEFDSCCPIGPVASDPPWHSD